MKKAKENQKTNQNQNGITLIALVVTIVVLLILAGITITTLFGENGLITTAKQADQKTQEGAQNDLDAIDEYNRQISELVNGTGEEVEPSEGTLLAMYNAGLSCANPDTCTNANHLHIGDYVNYVEPTSGSYPIPAAKSGIEVDQSYTLSSTVNNLNWRVLGIDKETKGIKLIADSPMKLDENATKTDHYLHLKGAEAYEYGPTIMNEACAMYKNSLAVKARSVNMQDIDEITGKVTDALREAVNFLTLQGALPLNSPYSFEDHYTPARWIEIGKADKEGTKGIPVSGITDGYAYVVAKTEEEKTTLEGKGMKPVLLTNTRVYDMLFLDTFFGGKPYWLSTRAVASIPSLCVYGTGCVYSASGVRYALNCVPSCFHSDGASEDVGMAVRPIVCLASGVTKEQVPKIADQPDSWGPIK